MKGFDKFVNGLIDEWKVPGLAIAIVKDGKVILSEGFGLRDMKNNLEATPETLFAIGSCTKALTATSIGILVDEGKLEWDRPVKEYLPDFRMYHSYVTENMTARDLLTHRSGLSRHDLVWYGAELTRKELYDRLRYLEPSKPFRTVYQYQNLMYMAAGYLIGQVSGGTWENFVREHILGPLGMENSNFSVNDSQESLDFALPYVNSDESINEVPFRNIDAMGPAGSINSSVTDMAKWVLANLNAGKHNDKQIVSEGSLRQIYSPYMVVPEPIKYDEALNVTYGMGWGISSYRGYFLMDHGGGIDGFSALVSMMPRNNIGMVILTNLGGTPISRIIAYNVYDRLLDLDEIEWNGRIRDEVEKVKKQAEENKKNAETDRKTGTRPSHSLEDYAGDFVNPAYGTISISAESDHLEFKFRSVCVPIEHYHYDVFHVVSKETIGLDTKISFSTDIHGNIESISARLEEPVSPIIFKRKN